MIDPRHDEILKSIDRSVMTARSVSDGLEFDWTSPDGRITTQKRVDTGTPKYLWPKGCQLPVGVPLGMQPLVDDTSKPIVIVEGTKQHLSAASAAMKQADPAKQVAVIGISGCWGWMQDGAPLKDFHLVPLTDRKVVVVFDADIATNRNVYDAAEKFGEFLEIECGAKDVRFARLSGEKDGFDDLLGRVKDTLVTFEQVVAKASPRLPKKPPKPSPYMSQWFDHNGRFLADDCAVELLTRNHMAVTADQTIAVYRDGLYMNGASREFNGILLGELGNDFRLSYFETVKHIVLTRLTLAGDLIPRNPSQLLINVRNGLLDPVTLQIKPHSPDFMTTWQLDVEWDPNATCPTYEAWVEQVCPGRVLELEDAVCPMLDPTRTPTKAVFLFGPSRSGKSTYARLLRAMVGTDATSAVTLHQLSDDKFSAANLLDKRLNLAMDLSAKEVRDLSVFKMMTGDDVIHANRKYGQQFAFNNQALIVFSANEVPPVSEVSKAYMARMAPFAFPHSFIGAEDPAIEMRMMGEIDGIFKRIVLALHARLKRGNSYLVSKHTDEETFKLASNKTAQYLAERTVKDEKGTERPRVYADYRTWCEQNGTQALGRNRFFESLRTEQVEEFTPQGGSKKFKLRLIDSEKGTVDDAVGRSTDRGAGVDGDGQNGVDEAGRDGSHAAGRTAEPAGSQVRVPGDGQTGGGNGQGLAASTAQGSVVFGSFGSFDPYKGNVPGAYSPLTKIRARHVLKGGFETAETTEPLPFDLETASVELLFDPRSNGSFIRICHSTEGTGAEHVVEAVTSGRPIAAHNGFGFDFHALGLDVLEFGDAGLLIDTMTLALLDQPPLGRQKAGQVMKEYSATAIAKRYGFPGKTGDIEKMAKEHGGFDQIPLDDEEYNTYCRADADIVASTLSVIPLTEYALREMRIMARLAGPITGTGFRVDVPLVQRRIAEGEGKRRSSLDMLKAYGLPQEGKSPQTSKEGRAAIEKAFADLGVILPRTPNDSPALGKDVLSELELTGEAAVLRDTVLGLNGIRTVYQTIEKHLVGDRVHSSIHPTQASGRFSVREPGLTVMGKRGGKHTERAVYLPDEGDVIVAFDLAQIDARAVAVLCQDHAYMDLFEPGRDSHQEVADMLGLSRDEAKAIAHGWNYGEGIAKLVKSTGLPLETVQQFDRGMRERFPRLVEWRNEMYEMGKAGVLLDNGFGRQLRVDPNFAFTQAPAYMGQSLARDLMCEGVLALPLDVARMIRGFVHDEIVMSIPEQDVTDVTVEVLKALEFEWAPTDSDRYIKVMAGASPIGRNWSQCYEGSKK